MKHFLYVFVAAICYIIPPTYASSLWHCLDPENEDKYTALVIQTAAEGIATVYSQAGVALTTINFKYQGLTEDKTMHVWRGPFGKTTAYFFRVDGKDEGAFAMKSPNQKEARVWICK